MERTKTIEVPASLYYLIESKLKGSKFGSISDYVSHVLRERVVSEGERSATHFSKEDEEKIKTRLKALGYL